VMLLISRGYYDMGQKKRSTMGATPDRRARMPLDEY
jgi:hypothetical protein